MPELILITNCQRHQSNVLNRHRDMTGEINADNAGRSFRWMEAKFIYRI